MVIMSKVSIVVPCYNEADTIVKFHQSVTSLWEENETTAAHELELLFINDGSVDDTGRILRELAASDPRIHYTGFSRNFGKEAAIFCGLKQASGDAVIVMDADLQHPPEKIPEMLLKWQEGYTVVEGIKSDRGREGAMHGLLACLFYRLFRGSTGIDIAGASDYKLLSRKAVDALNAMPERVTFFRALTYWTGFRSAKVTFDVADRTGGRSKWTGFSLLRYAINDLTSFSYLPLRIIGIMGLIVFFIGILLGIDAVISYFSGKSVGGYPSLVILITLSAGAILLSLGIIAIYLAGIYIEIKDRPRYLIEDRH